MGFVADADLRRPRRDPFESAPVGAMDGQFEGTATLMVRETGGAWNYGEEIDIGIVPNAWHELPFADFRLLYWSGIEVTLRMSELKERVAGAGGRADEQHFLVAALEPAKWGWCVYAPLRSENHHLTNEQRAERIRDSLDEGRQLQDLPWDPFLRDKGMYAARLNDPMRLHYEGGRNLGNGFVIGVQPEGVKKAIWHFGLCPAACLGEFGLKDRPAIPTPAVRVPQSEASTGSKHTHWPVTGTVRVPRTQPEDAAQAAVWYACAGRAEGDTITFQKLREKAERDLLVATLETAE